jgi:hypothetical protein
LALGIADIGGRAAGFLMCHRIVKIGVRPVTRDVSSCLYAFSFRRAC